MKILEDFPKLGIHDMALNFFELAIQSMGEHWRRLIFPTMGFPYLCFNLLNHDSDSECLSEYKKLQARIQVCPRCADTEFSTILLSYIDSDMQIDDPCATAKIRDVRRFLADIAIFGPLSTDLVECAHGYCQSLLHRWRGAKVNDDVAQERVMWSSVTTIFSKFQSWVWNQYADKWFKLRLAAFGQKGCNQYTSSRLNPDGTNLSKTSKDVAKTFTFEKMDRMLAFGREVPKLRKLCGSLPAALYGQVLLVK